jgi:prepilin-type N-terminal cleavage/methylation domain-containing protein
MTSARPKLSRAGFTLTEVLVALSLSLVVMGAIYSALGLHWKYSTAGRVDIERMQLVRAVALRIERDLRSTLFVAPPATASSDSGTATGTTSATGTAATGSTSAAAGSAASATGTGSTSGSTAGSTSSSSDSASTELPGLYGSASQLLIHASRPAGDLNYTSLAMGASVSSRLSDTLSIAWFLAGGDGSLAASVAGPGLARMEGDRMALKYADTSGDVGAMSGNTEIVAPEVTRLAFRYFDGVDWTAEWDSTVMQGLPFAVEIEFTVSHAGLGKFAPPVDTTQRIVVALAPATMPQEVSTEEE